jgi:hypothetical protein
MDVGPVRCRRTLRDGLRSARVKQLLWRVDRPSAERRKTSRILRIGNLFIGLPPGQKDPNGSRWQIAPQHHFRGVAEYPGITGRMILDWVAGYFRNRWPDDPGLRKRRHQATSSRRLTKAVTNFWA